MSDANRTSDALNTDLSHSGELRSEEILTQLQSRLARSTRARRAFRHACAATAGTAVIAAAAWLAWPRPTSTGIHDGGEVAVLPTPEPPSNMVTPPHTVETAAAPRRPVTIRIISDTGEQLAMCGAEAVGSAGAASSASTPRVCLLDDRQLLSALAETGGAYGMVRVNGQTVVLKDNKPLAAEPPPAIEFTPEPAE